VINGQAEIHIHHSKSLKYFLMQKNVANNICVIDYKKYLSGPVTYMVMM